MIHTIPAQPGFFELFKLEGYDGYPSELMVGQPIIAWAVNYNKSQRFDGTEDMSIKVRPITPYMDFNDIDELPLGFLYPNGKVELIENAEYDSLKEAKIACTERWEKIEHYGKKGKTK